MASAFEIEAKLKGYYPSTQKLTPEILREYERECGHWTNDEFDLALERYRNEDKKSEYCPNALQLRKYGPLGKEIASPDKEKRLWEMFYYDVEYSGWDLAVSNALGGNNGPEVKELIIRCGVKDMEPYEIYSSKLRQYFNILHNEQNPMDACYWMECNTEEFKIKEHWRKNKEYYEKMGLINARKKFLFLRMKDK